MPDYLLGHHHDEWQRLEAQHVLWRQGLLAVLSDHGLAPGARVLEVGCGSGALLEDLAHIAGSATTSGLERDADAAERVRQRLAAVTLIEGDLRDAPLGGPYDLIVVRWVFSFFDHPGPAISRLVEHLAPGGRLVVQDYNHDGVGVWPHHAAIQSVIEGYREAYRLSGGDLWVAAKLPQLLAELGLPVHDVVPEVKVGGVDSDVWRWVETFVHGHLGSLEALRTEAELQAFRDAWATARSTEGAVLFSPMVVTVVTGPTG